MGDSNMLVGARHAGLSVTECVVLVSFAQAAALGLNKIVCQTNSIQKAAAGHLADKKDHSQALFFVHCD